MTDGYGVLSVGESYPLESLWNAGYSVRIGGYILGICIAVYEPPGRRVKQIAKSRVFHTWRSGTLSPQIQC
jgi:hypothetical protein